jgi:hypothetical protein
MNDLKVCWWPIDKPVPYARNGRKIPERAIDKVAASIKEFGFRQCIVVDKDGIIIPMASSTGSCTTPTGSRCAVIRCGRIAGRPMHRANNQDEKGGCNHWDASAWCTQHHPALNLITARQGDFRGITFGDMVPSANGRS